MNSEAVRRSLLPSVFEFLSPKLRTALLNDAEFARQWGFPTIAGVTLGKEGPSFQCVQLYGGIRNAIRELGRAVPLRDEKGETWQITARDAEDGLNFVVDNGEKRLGIGDHSGLAEEKSIRLGWLSRVSQEVNLDVVETEKWKAAMERQPLDDEQFVELTSELEFTPVRNYHNLRSGMARGSLDLATLVPADRRYYARLIGPLGSASDAGSYLEGGARQRIEALQNWDHTLGFLLSLLVCSNGIVSRVIGTKELNSEELLRTYEWLANHGDPISQLGSVEVALRDVERHREVEPFIEKMVEGFVTDDPTCEGGMFSLLSAMIVMVASELSRKRILGDVRPFYRRQAAIAQASLIVRAMYGSQVDSASIVEWARTSGFGYLFVLQGLVDLRREPRWLPDFVSPSQLRAEFIGRVANAVEGRNGEVKSDLLRCLLMGSESILSTAVAVPLRMLPGPLEGERGTELANIPEEVLNRVAEELSAEKLEPDSFGGLVNMALLFKMPLSHAGLAAEALRRVRYTIENAEGHVSLFGLVEGLATVAAVTRGTDLAEELRVLVRVMRRRNRLNASPDDEMRVAMIAAASHENVDEWARFAGEWMTELAYEVVERGAAESFLPKIRRLVEIEPALARHCTAADAAIESVIG